MTYYRLTDRRRPQESMSYLTWNMLLSMIATEPRPVRRGGFLVAERMVLPITWRPAR